jgi:hypothetical protein
VKRNIGWLRKESIFIGIPELVHWRMEFAVDIVNSGDVARRLTAEDT